MKQKMYVCKCPVCGKCQGLLTKDVSKARKVCVYCGKNFKAHKHISAYSTLKSEENYLEDLRLKVKEYNKPYNQCL